MGFGRRYAIQRRDEHISYYNISAKYRDDLRSKEREKLLMMPGSNFTPRGKMVVGRSIVKQYHHND